MKQVIISLLAIAVLLLTSCDPGVIYVVNTTTQTATETTVILQTLPPQTITHTQTLPPQTVTLPASTITTTLTIIGATQTTQSTSTTRQTTDAISERDLVQAMAYPSMVIGAYVYQLGINLYNGSSQTITVNKIEFVYSGAIVNTIGEDEIRGQESQGHLSSGFYFNWNVSFQIPHALDEVLQWQVKWYCSDIAGNFVVTSTVNNR
jgi:hypothetical protein